MRELKSPGQVVSVARHTKGNNPITVLSVVIGEPDVRSSIVLPLILHSGVGVKVYKTLSL